MRPPNEMYYNKNVKTAFIAPESSRSTEHFSLPFLPSVSHSYCISDTVEFLCCPRLLVLLNFCCLFCWNILLKLIRRNNVQRCQTYFFPSTFASSSPFFSFNSISLAEVISSERFRGIEMILSGKIHQIAVGFMHLLLFSFQSFAVVWRRAAKSSRRSAVASPWSLLLNSFASSFIHTLIHSARREKMFFIGKFIDNVSKMIFPRLTNINK